MDVRLLLITVFYWIFSVVTAQLNDGEPCRTPLQKKGTCILLPGCPQYVSILNTYPTPQEDLRLVQKATCGFVGKVAKVCCPLNDTRVELTQFATPLRSNLLPNENSCGMQDAERLIGGENTTLTEFPWMVLLDYEKPDGRGFHCGGALINDRYVLTAAHCLKGRRLPKDWIVNSVRLGEHNTETDVDCIAGDCSEPPLNIPVVERIPHEDYDPLSKNQYHDIALLRLARKVKLSPYIQPICLPTSTAQLNNRYAGSTQFVSGWGRTENSTESAVKLKLQVPIKTTEECVQKYGSAGVAVGSGQLCAGGVRGEDSCRGDSGGPLMTDRSTGNIPGIWYITGVVSFGPTICGLPGWPGIYTRVAEYMPWIISNLKS